MKVNMYKNFKSCRGEFELTAVLEGIQRGKWSKAVNQVRLLFAENRNEEAGNLKKTLISATLSGLYSGRRGMRYLKQYNFALIIDIDHVPQERMEEIRQVIREDVHTYADFLSPSGTGRKAIFLLEQTARYESDELVSFHAAAYNQVADYLEQKINFPVDRSGKDIQRIFFVSYDPELYVNARCCPFPVVFEPAAGDVAPQPKAAANKRKKPVAANGDKSIAERFRQSIYRVSRKGKYEPGNRNNYCFRLMCECNREGIPAPEAEALLKAKFSDLPVDEAEQIRQSAYAKVEEFNLNQQPAKNSKKGESRHTPLPKIEAFLSKIYDFRYNVVTDMVEYSNIEKDLPWEPLSDRFELSCWRAVLKAGMFIGSKSLHGLLASDFSPAYHPYTTYFDSLPPWDGTDYIAQWAARVPVADPEFFEFCFRKWLVALVASLLCDSIINHTMIILCGKQGEGKSTFGIHLLPPELRAYYSCASIDPAQNESLLRLSTRALICLDELESLSPRRWEMLKEFITLQEVDTRKVWRMNPQKYPHRASMMAFVNNTDILTDISGTRRFLSFEVTGPINNREEIPYAGMYAQAYALMQSGFTFWFKEKDVEKVNLHNEDFRVRTLEEELFHSYYRAPEGDDEVFSMSASQIIGRLCYKCNINSSQMKAVTLGRILKKTLSCHRVKGVTQFLVHELSQGEIDQQKKIIPPAS